MHPAATRYDRPLVSVLAPVRDEAGNVGQMLDTVHAQGYPVERLELVVIDGRSSDTTIDEVVCWAKAHPEYTLRILDNPARAQAAGFNIGLSAAHGDLVFLLSSAHGRLDPGYLPALVGVLEQDEAGEIWVVGGRSEAYGRTDWGDAVARALASPASLGGPAWRTSQVSRDVDHVAYGLYRWEAFAHAGTFDERLAVNEDYELTYRVRRAGGRVHLHQGPRAAYLTRDTPSGLARQYLRYGRFKTVVGRRHPGSLRLRHLAPAAFVAGMATLAGLSTRSRTARVALGAAAAAYASALGYAARRETRDDPAQLPRTAAAIALMHLCYGVGNFYGAVPGALATAVSQLDGITVHYEQRGYAALVEAG